MLCCIEKLALELKVSVLCHSTHLTMAENKGRVAKIKLLVSFNCLKLLLKYIPYLKIHMTII